MQEEKKYLNKLLCKTHYSKKSLSYFQKIHYSKISCRTSSSW